MQNSALGAVLAQAHFAANPLAAVPCAISACTHSMLGSLLAAWWRSRPADDEGPAQQQQQQSGEWAVQAGAAAQQLQQAQAAAGRQLAVAKAAANAATEVAARKSEAAAWIAAWRARTAAGATDALSVGAAEVASAPTEGQSRVSHALDEADLAARKSQVRRMIEQYNRRSGKALGSRGGSSGGGGSAAPTPLATENDSEMQRLSGDEMEALLSSDSF